MAIKITSVHRFIREKQSIPEHEVKVAFHAKPATKEDKRLTDVINFLITSRAVTRRVQIRDGNQLSILTARC